MRRRLRALSPVVALGILAILSLSSTTLADPPQSSDMASLTAPGANPYLEIGDKRFENFTISIVGDGTFSASAANIGVSTFQADNGDYGLLFTDLNIKPMFSVGPDSWLDVLIQFDVVVTDPNWKLHDIGLSFVGAAPDDGFIQIVETALDGATVVGQAQVDSIVGASDHLVFPGEYQTLRISKDIALLGGDIAGASIGEFTQTFSQIPEPTTMVLLFGGVGLLAIRRRRFRSSLAVGLLVAASIAGQSSTASAAVPLQDLIDNTQNLPVLNHLQFSNFSIGSVVNNGKVIGVANAPITTSLMVTPVNLGGEEGIQFSGLLGAFSAITPNADLEFTLDYTVTSLTPNIYIHDASLAFNGAKSPSTNVDARAQIGESLSVPGQPSPFSSLLVTTDSLTLSVHQEYAPDLYTTLNVHNRVVVQGGANGVATISFINQTFSLQEVPEPSTVGLLVLGLPALLKRRRNG